MSTFAGNYIDGKPFVTRYIRPTEYRAGAEDYTYSPTGGIGIGVVIDSDNSELEFSLSMCSDKDRFRKSTAFQVLRGRVKSGDKFKLKGYNKGYSLVENVACALAKEYSDKFLESLLTSEIYEVGTELVSKSDKSHPVVIEEFFWAVATSYEGTLNV